MGLVPVMWLANLLYYFFQCLNSETFRLSDIVERVHCEEELPLKNVFVGIAEFLTGCEFPAFVQVILTV